MTRPLAIAGLLLVLATGPVQAAETAVTRADVEAWADAYSYWYEHPGYPHDALLADVLSVMRCESGQFDPAVLNNVRRGRLGEVGAGQFLPRGGIWPYTPQAQAGFSMFDQEANVAALTWGVSRGYGPRHWRGCW